MTWKEKISRDDPIRVDEKYKCGMRGCPPDIINQGCDCDCTACWNREVPDEYLKGDTEVPHIKDSGDRTEFASGAVRDMHEGKGRCDLLPLDVVGSITNNRILSRISEFQDDGLPHHLTQALSIADDALFSNKWTMFLEVAKHFEEGAKKYGDNNWRKGIPVRCYIDSAVRHYLKYLRGDKDEPHDRAFCWNILCAIWTCKHKPELNDYAKEDKNE